MSLLIREARCLFYQTRNEILTSFPDHFQWHEEVRPLQKIKTKITHQFQFWFVFFGSIWVHSIINSLQFIVYFRHSLLRTVMFYCVLLLNNAFWLQSHCCGLLQFLSFSLALPCALDSFSPSLGTPLSFYLFSAISYFLVLFQYLHKFSH